MSDREDRTRDILTDIAGMMAVSSFRDDMEDPDKRE